MRSTVSLRLLAGVTALVHMGAWAKAQGSESVSWQEISQPLIGWAGALLLVVLIFAGVAWRRRSTPAPDEQGSRLLPWILFTLAIALGAPAWDALNHSPTQSAQLQITCTASQWKWHFAYTHYQGRALDGPRFVSAMQTPASIDSDTLARQLFGARPRVSNPDELLEVDHPLVLPAGAKVQFAITSEDSVHAWWIPGLNIKKEAIPGFVQTVDVQLPAQTGVYHGMCSQLCGQDHAFMPIVVKLVPLAEFEAWLPRTRASLAAAAERSIPATLDTDQLMTLGNETFRNRCALCHLASGEGATERIPALSQSPLVSGAAAPLLTLLMQGRNVMPGMQGVLAHDEMAALATYVRARFGKLPPTEAAVQPEQLSKTF